ncbi:2-amino-4-hydroxy-6-hydroxymethyldihydropteridine diphosphokinase [Pelagibacteraceae bacterium]|jgi:2-amino-4-hydroxy-6-hydroxymethyldihydropteridine diphosphokinase|nr:2-amino-4-hydroxy-6-hydroxymethyldihydropteridine diphosphokinase [Pelagibacteraceae bacterium]
MIHLNIGSNLNSLYGNRFENIIIAVNLLISLKLKIKKISNFYETPSFPNKKLPKFINIGLLAEYDFNPIHLLKETSLIEKKIGRILTKKNSPRVCDIDIIDFSGLIKKDKLLKIPHPRCHVRNFVLYPIREIDPKWIHPVFKKNVDFLIDELAQNSRIEITRLHKSVIV